VIVLFYFDWFGPAKELSKLEKTLTAAAAKGSGVKYKGTYAPDNRKFHFVSMFETKSYDKLMEILMDPKNRQGITTSSLTGRLKYSADP